MKEEIEFRNYTRKSRTDRDRSDSFCDGPRILACTRANVIFDWMANLAIDAAGGKDKVFGTKPKTADYTPTDLGVEANKAVKSNIANYGDIAALLERLLPGYGEMVKTGSRNTQSLLRGEIPQDVQDSLKRSSAYRSLQGGYAGSGMSKALTARDFGRTSLDLMDQGQNSAQRWMQMTQGSASPYMVTAPAQAESTFKNNLYKQATEQMKYNVAAAPDPGAAGLFNTIATIGGTAASFGLSSMGGAGGGAGGGARTGSGVVAGANSANSAYPYNWWDTRG